MQHFPQELVDLVIDDVAAAPDTTDIGTCGLVCSQWLPRSRRHLFSDINLSNADSAAIQAFMDLVDASSTPILALVKLLDMHLVNGPFTEAHMARLHGFHAVSDLRIHSPCHVSRDRMPPVEDLRFQCWLQTHIPRFGSACLSLTRFELVLGSDLPFRILVDIISSLPSLTRLRICGENGYGLLESGTVAPTDAFPPHLRTLDISLHRGTNLFFEWLLLYDKSPVFTSLKLGGIANGAPLGPIEEYLKYVSPKIESLSFSHWVDGGLGSSISASLGTHTDFAALPKSTYTFEDRVLACTQRLVHLSLARQYPKSLVDKLMSLSSLHLATISIEVRPMRIDWPSIDVTVGTPRFAALRRLLFTDQLTTKTRITAEVRAMMPQASARGILE
ncbi:hypothetical protein C8R44DRAFT_871434 [Mycena epipterygia]|nr:hypothetical protein C8R44DRAFT_871434 [Mycena epipterygia]